jgi:hypothetical protein
MKFGRNFTEILNPVAISLMRESIRLSMHVINERESAVGLVYIESKIRARLKLET